MPDSEAKAPSQRKLILVICACLVVITGVTYWNVHKCDFLYFDDVEYIINNRSVHMGLTRESIGWALTTFHAANWHPITWFTHMIDYEFFGMNPRGHHLVNLFFHIINTLLLFFFLIRSTKGYRRSAVVALLFALHPLHIESVAWVAERKDVISTLFWLLAMACYRTYALKPNPARYALTALMLCFGLMAKPMVVTLPCVFLLMDYWPLNRIEFDRKNLKPFLRQAQKLLVEKIPFFALVFASCILTVFAQKSYSAVGTLSDFPFGVRIGNALVSYVQYIIKTFWPFPMAVYYPHPHTGIAAWKVVGALTILMAVTGLVLRLGKRFPYLIFGWFFYLGTLVPVIGFVQVGGQAMADRYTYVPLIGLFIMLSWSIRDMTLRLPFRKTLLSGAGVVLVLALMGGTWKQLQYWESSIPLFKHTLDVAGPSAVIYNNLGTAYIDKGNRDKAISCFRKSIEISPTYTIGMTNLGLALYEKKAYEESLKFYLKAMEISPDHARLQNNLGSLYLKKKQLDKALPHFKRAVELDPDYVEALSNLGRVHLERGELEKAALHLNKSLSLDPDHARSRNNMGGVLARRGNLEGAIGHFKKALELNPDFSSAHNNLGIALAQKGQLDEAIKHFSRALELDPENESARDNLAFANSLLKKKGDK